MFRCKITDSRNALWAGVSIYFVRTLLLSDVGVLVRKKRGHAVQLETHIIFYFFGVIIWLMKKIMTIQVGINEFHKVEDCRCEYYDIMFNNVLLRLVSH